jgi:hypothetical protein
MRTCQYFRIRLSPDLGALEIRIGLQYISGYFNKKEMSARGLVKATSPSLNGLSHRNEAG